MAIQFSSHAINRVTGRLSGLVTLAEVESILSQFSFRVGETHVLIKSLPRKLKIKDGDKLIVGDRIYAVYRRASAGDRGCVATVELRGASQKVKGDYQKGLTLTRAN